LEESEPACKPVSAALASDIDLPGDRIRDNFGTEEVVEHPALVLYSGKH
jgi:hypothetical protein